jgi:hypothetical protein
MPTRQEVYKAINTERAYQDNVVDTDPQRRGLAEHSVGDFLTLMASYLRKAQDDWCQNPGVRASLHQVRKIAGIAVKCMEEHGAPKRNK